MPSPLASPEEAAAAAAASLPPFPSDFSPLPLPEVRQERSAGDREREARANDGVKENEPTSGGRSRNRILKASRVSQAAIATIAKKNERVAHG